jgi:hypothetical protein
MIRIVGIIEDPYLPEGQRYEAILAGGRRVFLTLRRYQAAVSGWDRRAA